HERGHVAFPPDPAARPGPEGAGPRHLWPRLRPLGGGGRGGRMGTDAGARGAFGEASGLPHPQGP
ncbi:hypothetical protein ABTQ03_19425, partial [Acinetobacter baumannii]